MSKFNFRYFIISLATLAAVTGVTSEIIILCNSPLYRPRNILLLCSFTLLLLACISTFFYEAKHRRRFEKTKHMLQFERRLYRSALMADCDYAYTVNVTENKLHTLNRLGYLQDYNFNPTVPFDTDTQIICECMHPTVIIGKSETFYTKDLQAAFDEGKRLLDSVYYIPDADLYKRKTVFLSEDKSTSTVYAFVVSHDVSEEYRTSARTKQALHTLTRTAEEIASGNLDAEIDCSADGDIGILAQSLRHTVDHLKSYISNINNLASTDSMTNMKNRTAYLGSINDNFGHAEGDKYIISTAKRLRQYFPDAELFRFGGDEFVAILFDVSPTEIDEMIINFEESLARRSKHLGYKMSIACGYALYHESYDVCFADVYNRADAAMYAQKRKLKGRASAQ